MDTGAGRQLTALIERLYDDVLAPERKDVTEVYRLVDILEQRTTAPSCRFGVNLHSECFARQQESGMVGCTYHGSH